MLRSFHHRYGLDCIGLRYMNVYGLDRIIKVHTLQDWKCLI